MATVRRGTNRFKEILQKAKDVRCYTLENYFAGEPLAQEPLDPVAGWTTHTTPSGYLRGVLEVFRFAKLQDMGEGKFCVHVHSNEWYEFTN